MAIKNSSQEKFFSPQRNFKSSFTQKVQNFTPNLSHSQVYTNDKELKKHNMQNFLIQKSHLNTSNEEEWHKAERVPNFLRSKEKSELKTDPNTNKSYYLEEKNEVKELSSNGTSQVRENYTGIMFKEWKIQKTDEIIGRFEGQMQVLLKENEKLMKISKEKQNEIDRIKAGSFVNSCKLKELESKNDLLKEELDHSIQLIKEKEDDIQMWKSKFFENEQKVSNFDSIEYKLMENEYLLMDYQRKIEELSDENEKLKYFQENNDQIVYLIEGIDSIFHQIQSKNDKTHSADFSLNMSFQTPEKAKHDPLGNSFSQLKIISSFLETTREESPKLNLIKKLEKELENEKKEKLALNSKINFLRNAKFKDLDKNKSQELEKEIYSLKRQIEDKSKENEDLSLEIKNMKKEAGFYVKKIENLEKSTKSDGEKILSFHENFKDKENLLEELRKKNEKIVELEKKIFENETKHITDQIQKEELLQKLKLEVQKNLAQNSEDYKSLSHDLQSAKSNNEQLNKKIDDLASQNEKLVLENSQITLINKRLSEKLQEFDEKEKSFNNKILNLQKEIDISTQNFENLRNEKNETIQKNTQNYIKLETKYMELENSLSTSSFEHQKKENQILSLKSQLNEKEENYETVNRMKSELRDLRMELENYKEENRKLLNKNSELSGLNEENLRSLQEKEIEILNLEERISKNQIENNEINEKLNSHINDLNLEKENFKTKVGVSFENERKYSELEKELQKKNQIIFEKEKEIHLLKNEKLNQTQSFFELERKYSELQKKHSEMEILFRDNLLKLTEKEKEMNDFGEKQNFDCTHHETIEQLNTKILELTAEIDQYRSSKNQDFLVLEKKYLDLEKNFNKCLLELTEKKNEINEMKAKTSEIINKLRFEVNDLTLKNNELMRNQTSDEFEKQTNFNETIENLNREIFNLREKNEELFKNNIFLSEIKEKKENLHEKEEFKMLAIRINELETLNAELCKKINIFGEEISQKNQDISSLVQEKELLSQKAINPDLIMKSKEQFELAKNEMLSQIQKLQEELTNSKGNTKFYQDSLEKARKETRLLFFLAVVVILCISLFFFMS